MDYSKKQPIIEAYPAVQGEGKYVGIPHLCIRFTGCRLRCQFAGTFCDTHYASWKPEKGSWSLDEIVQLIEDHPQIKHTFITGGGPTLHSTLLKEVTKVLKKYDHHITIETEGSEYVDTVADCISLSPKLGNSTPIVGTTKPWDGKIVTEKEQAQHEKWRKNYSAMEQLISSHPEYQLKPVISSEEDLEEVKFIQKTLDIPNKDVWLMPEGVTDEELMMKRKWLFDICIEEGYNYTDRLHVIVYGDERGV